MTEENISKWFGVRPDDYDDQAKAWQLIDKARAQEESTLYVLIRQIVLSIDDVLVDDAWVDYRAARTNYRKLIRGDS